MNRMKECRRARHMTQKEVGKIIGLSQATISLYEKGTHEPDMQTLKRLSQVYGVSIEYMLGYSDEQIKQVPTGSQLDDQLVNMLTKLNQNQVQRVRDFIAGMQANDER